MDIETAILAGYAPDGGLYVPDHLPQVSSAQLDQWKDLSYKELAFEIVSLFIDSTIISADDLMSIINTAYDSFEKEDVIPIHQLKSRHNTYVMELYHGSTLSFKDIGMSFLVNLVNFFLKRKDERLSIIVATTGDTGPAAASYIAGKETLDAWVLYPKGMITEEQERQMTTLTETNVHPVGVYNCPDGADDLDALIGELFADKTFKEKVNLSSINSINWGRIMIQMVHYFYGYFQIIDAVGEKINVAVPSGAFGNLCAGGLARKMGLPIDTFIIANNKNQCLHRIFSEGFFSKEAIHETVSSAIDILIPLNFWRFLYFCVGEDANKIKSWMDEFHKNDIVHFDKISFEAYREGFISGGVSDELTLATIKEIYEAEEYLMDPHTAVSLAVAASLRMHLGEDKLMCLSTAHPAKFPEVIQKALGADPIPKDAQHKSIETAKERCQKGYTVDYMHYKTAIAHSIEQHWEQTRGSRNNA